MKLFKITYHDAWESKTLETFIFAQSALAAEVIFTEEEDSFCQVIDVREVQ
ncbi:hypothetical protein Zip_15 [Enterococcus phage vB_EfaP_Zip]|uniref:Uncharacterized protein n=1 Tax=Enterococcus phage vB_EfaP_Zip TaxID=2501743 RepID=A0A411B6W4_9CAUD|nr:hypothetical protein H3T63_gp15 [Enterococcus phage vB_EfaP_Zip]QAX97336.1 hypothetical protein Zip_15 [Enterococcus phage vB_EfaP_Zip]